MLTIENLLLMTASSTVITAIATLIILRRSQLSGGTRDWEAFTAKLDLKSVADCIPKVPEAGSAPEYLEFVACLQVAQLACCIQQRDEAREKLAESTDRPYVQSVESRKALAQQ